MDQLNTSGNKDPNGNSVNTNNNNNSHKNPSGGNEGGTPLSTSLLEGLGTVVTSQLNSGGKQNNKKNNQVSQNNSSNRSGSSSSSLYEGLGSVLASQLNSPSNTNNQQQSNQNSNNSALGGLASILGNQLGGGSNNNSNSGKSPAFGAIESIFSSLPKEQQKSIVMECISPVILKLSPKWGAAIVAVLRNFDVTKLIPLAKDEKELAKTVADEEKKLENRS